ncbi:hypothetical protein, partial [Phenylobacterium sp.]|uniref:hypothetical protein n=1 Tax=Phenylobacterium sp. TaxID=1871053 RepID=UPI0037837A83
RGPKPDVIEVEVAGQVIQRYRVGQDGRGDHVNPGAPAVVAQTTYGDTNWMTNYRGFVTTYSLNAEGDVVGQRSGDVPDWLSPRFVLAFNPSRPGLDAALKAALGQIHEEADRFEGHNHSHEDGEGH